ncbi:unnamed protein product [Mycena citricolor]|uniref:Enoyl reductase (ER) domain-containing protein n=1 Tax=Mycena citricolor TaxID=2018698 RepID=A0AAD2Q7D1_9AGAR|nr:unnamed protein product [Mycena citricolor]CAK5284438.1 unnamed protein product [Mycena citricolor]
MAPTPNHRILYVKVPGHGLPVEGEHLVYDTDAVIDLDAPLNGGYLTKTLLLSPEPYMRERLRDPAVQLYSPPMVLGQPMVGNAVVVVLRSEMEGVNAGDYMAGLSTWEMYTVQPYTGARVNFAEGSFPPYTLNMEILMPLRTVPDPQGAFPWTCFLTSLGLPGYTAFEGIEKYLKPKEGSAIYVSSGASAVGTMVIQLCKRRGLRVIASAGSDQKVDHLLALGADVAFNYKTRSVASALEEYGPLDYYWDNVGGEQLEAAIGNMQHRGRIMICGAMSEYNVPFEQRYGVKNLSMVFKRRITIEGFVCNEVPDAEFYGRFIQEIPPILAEKKLQSEEDLVIGMENGIKAFLSLFDGTANAKVVVVVDPEYA